MHHCITKYCMWYTVVGKLIILISLKLPCCLPSQLLFQSVKYVCYSHVSYTASEHVCSKLNVVNKNIQQAWNVMTIEWQLNESDVHVLLTHYHNNTIVCTTHYNSKQQTISNDWWFYMLTWNVPWVTKWLNHPSLLCKHCFVNDIHVSTVRVSSTVWV